MARYSRVEFNRLLDMAERQMANQGALPGTAAGAHEVLNRLRNGGYSGGQTALVTPQEITLARQALSGMKNTTDTNARTGLGATTLRNTLDDFLQNPGSAVVQNPGAALQASQVAGQLRREYASMARSREMVEEANNARMVEATGGAPARGRLQTTGRTMLTEEGGRFPNLQGHTAAERDLITAAITPNPVAATAGRTLQMVPGFENAGKRLEGFSGRGIQRRWDEAAETLRERAPAYERAIQGSVPVPGPGMGALGQGVQGGTREALVTPPDDGRDAVAWSYMQELMR